MKLELAQKHFSEGWGVFDVGCVLRDTQGAEFEIVRFSGVSQRLTTPTERRTRTSSCILAMARRWNLRH